MNVGDVRNRVFISYAHEDIELAEDFRKHLAVRLRAEAPVWIDTEIRAGERWENALNDALHGSGNQTLRTRRVRGIPAPIYTS